MEGVPFIVWGFPNNQVQQQLQPLTQPKSFDNAEKTQEKTM